MTPQELIAQCDQQIEMLPGTARITLVMPGKCGKRLTKRLAPGGPIGDIVSESHRGLVVMFDAREVKRFVERKLEQIAREEAPNV